MADSIPEKEFQECINKAKAVVEAIKKAQQMVAYEEKENDDDTIDPESLDFPGFCKPFDIV